MSPDVEALSRFAHGEDVAGPISELGAQRAPGAPQGARVSMSADAPEFQPAALAVAPPPAWPRATAVDVTGRGQLPTYQPWTDSAKTRQQATAVLEALSSYEMTKATNPWWAKEFWQWSARANAAEAFTGEVLLLYKRQAGQVRGR